MKTMFEYAKAMTQQGYECFPLRGKIPAIAGGRGCLDATRNTVELLAMFAAAHPSNNFGIRLPVGQIVIDIDPRHGGHKGLADLEAKYGDLPATRTSESGRRDGGRHYFFTCGVEKPTSRRLPEGVDLKSRGGYVVSPPSLHPDTGLAYRWIDTQPPVPAPDWLVALITPTLEPVVDIGAGNRFLAKGGAGADTNRRVVGVVQAVMDAAEGTRNSLLYWGSCRFAEMVAAAEMSEADAIDALRLAGAAVGLSAAECDQTIRSGLRTGIAA